MKNNSFLIPIALLANVLPAQVQKTPESTELWEPIPQVVVPGESTGATLDAIVLFDGTNLDEWANVEGKQAEWKLAGGCMTIIPGSGSIITKRSFGGLSTTH